MAGPPDAPAPPAQGFVVLEAMASGVPVVAVAAGGITDIITSPGVCGARACSAARQRSAASTASAVQGLGLGFCHRR